ncbi:Phosphatidylinositol-glycan biosynthesis class X-like protein [Hirschfeldia incana]|nr:Phosphatidylinositol-glycan biosynthesis class X-like protein [Hirschfeldia incana]
MESSKRGRSVISAIFIFFALSCFNPISTTQVELSDSDTFCVSDHYIMQSYFTTNSSLDESEFRSFLRLQQCSENISNEDVPVVAMLQQRDITGEGSHRHLLTSIKLRSFNSQSQLHEVVIVERLPLGVFADPFELQSLQQRRAFRDVSVFGDTDLEQPSFRSNRSVVEIHVDVSETGEISVKLPLHARYQPIGESGYSRVEFGEPDLFLCSRLVPNEEHEQRRCLVLSIGRSKTETSSVVWEIPAGIRSHTEYVSVITFVAAVLSALSILVASVLSSKVESCKNTKQS